MFFECIALVNKLYNTSISMKNEQFINIQLGLPEKWHAKGWLSAMDGI